MLNEIIYAIVQAAAGFFPISSSGHLSLISNFIDKPNLFLITLFHMASLIAVLIFLKNEIFNLLTFEKRYRKIWLYLIIGTIPALLFGFFFKGIIEKGLSSFLFIGIFFLFTSIIVFLTKFAKTGKNLNWKNSLLIGLMQALALFPGISRAGMTISTGFFAGVKKEESVKFSFLLFIPVMLGAFFLEALEVQTFQLTFSIIFSFILCVVLSYFFFYLLFLIVRKNKFWIFSIYTFIIGILSLAIYFFS